MSHEEQENQGTGLRDVFDILFKKPRERLVSLTFQLGESLEDNIIHALCLIVLQRDVEALNKLQMLEDNYLANHLAERWRTSGGILADFGLQCGEYQDLPGESLAVLARIFKVLSAQRLCEPVLRDLAYQRALSTDRNKTSSSGDLEYDQLREEAKFVCGPQFEEWMCSLRDLKSGSCHDQHESLDGLNTTLKVIGQSERASPLQVSSSMPSYPTHLEISIPPTVLYQEDRISPEALHESKQNPCVVLESQTSQTSEKPHTKAKEPSLFHAKRDSKIDAAILAEHRNLEVVHTVRSESPKPSLKLTSEPKLDLPTPTNTFTPSVQVPSETHEYKGEMCQCKYAEEEEEETKFYAFVILHVPEDADMAESMKEKLERITGGDGATSDDFAIPGKSSLKCVENAINNSAFTLLLLTRNFSTRMDVEIEAALVNSINKRYKHNTVIPLLPKENSMPRERIPMFLQTIIPLEEKKNFEKKVKKSMSPANIKRQEKIWKDEQMAERQRARRLNICQPLQMENVSLLMRHKLLPGPSVPPDQGGGDGRAMWPPQANIHIENARYIMIGNDSQMTVDHCGGADKNDSIFSVEDQ